MKLIRFVTEESSNPEFGTVIANHAVAFSVLQSKVGTLSQFLSDSRTYLEHLPESEVAARTLLAWGEEHFQDLDDGEMYMLDFVQLLEPIKVAALFDFGLTPRHLKNSFKTMMKFY